jgi:hypothetical protein
MFSISVVRSARCATAFPLYPPRQTADLQLLERTLRFWINGSLGSASAFALWIEWAKTQPSLAHSPFAHVARDPHCFPLSFL